MIRTHHTLAQAVHEPTQAPTGAQQRQLSDTLEHMGEVREGFILSQRMPLPLESSGLRKLIQHILLNWQWIEDMDLSLIPADRVELVGNQIVAFQHALVALGILPRLPAQAITFPQARPTYADVSAPAAPDELLERIEEIERILYQAGSAPLVELAFDPFRRTYAFFEASSWLVNHYLPPILGD
jgi:hypothetical protein